MARKTKAATDASTPTALTPPQPPALATGPVPQMPGGMTFREIGQSGLRAFAGYVREDYLPVLTGRQAARIYREMSDGDPTIGALLFAINATMRKVEWRTTPADDSPAAQEMADFVDELRDDMSMTFEDVVVEGLSMLVYGYAPMELVYKRRMGRQPFGGDTPSSRYNDGRIGWRKIPIRGQDTIIKWFFGPNGEILGYTQQPYSGPLVDVPMEKSLLFRPSQHKSNPEGRPLPLNTPVRTPSGWTTMGAIAVGDQVYDESGAVRNVVGKSEVFRDRPVYEIEFTTGASVRADACHLWRVSDNNDRTHGRLRDMTTEQIAKAYDADADARTMPGPSTERWNNRRARSICCGTAPVLQSPDVPLPLDPYVLGYWLGDGITSKAAISVHPKDLFSIKTELEAHGFRVNHDGNTTAGIAGGLLFGLRAAGVLGDKHVPRRYMDASPAQRLALLQGLMDSDGYSPGADSKDEASTFANTNHRLIDAVVELVRSLGSQPRVRVLEEAGALGGIINGKQIVARQTSFEVRFMLDLPVHRLPRKRHAQVLRKTHRNSGHFVRSVQRVENADTVCIEVDSPSHLFLAGESMVPTHNSILRSSYRPWFFIKRLEEQEAILYERLNGFPVIRVPGSLMEQERLNNPDAVAAMAAFRKIAVNLRVDEQMGLVMPSDTFQGPTGPSSQYQYSFELVAPGGTSGGGKGVQANETIGRHQTNMLATVLADFIALGHGARGSQALSVDKTDMFFQAIEGFLNSMASVFNRYAIPRIFALNGLDLDLCPELTPDLAQRLDLDVLGNFILRLSQAGMPLFPNDELSSAVLDSAGLPDITESENYQDALDAQAQLTNPPVDPLTGQPDMSQTPIGKMILQSYLRRLHKHGGTSPMKKRRRRPRIVEP